ncbi:F0F1 ATP synthase subunit A [Fodinisporobacter ferrooxydans]|uniref:ATP synthase subunit a n=1 Tax=Fodinisporobacter ferrooxydans TaxID=2901836 RepID=A0ABY4CM62_9BACL|nr:F0F1 ATP synthase subunit A [Alicyclobacillaceae bacterium MYW30-H2]
MEHAFPKITIAGLTFNLTVIGMSIITALIVAIVARAAASRLDQRSPSGLQNFFEWVVDFVRGLARDMMDEETAEKYLPLGLVMITYLFVANWMGLITNVVVHTETGSSFFGIKPGDQVSFFMSPTADLSLAMGMSLMVNIYAHAIGLRHPKAYFGHYVQPYALMLPMTIIEEVSKILTLGLRLFGNIFAGEVLIAVCLQIPKLFGVLPTGVIPLFPWLAYSGFVSSIQAFVFTVLTFVYISSKANLAHHH